MLHCQELNTQQWQILAPKQIQWLGESRARQWPPGTKHEQITPLFAVTQIVLHPSGMVCGFINTHTHTHTADSNTIYTLWFKFLMSEGAWMKKENSSFAPSTAHLISHSHSSKQ